MKKEQLLDLYHQMVLIRRVEERGAELYQAGKIGGFMHLYIGQEAVSTGLIAAREPRDRVITAYRDHGVAINCGIPVNEVMAELLGKATGMSKGKGGSMHMASVEKNMWGGHAIVGGHLPIAAGLALGDQYAKNDNVTICMFGDGATNIGYFHEEYVHRRRWLTEEGFAELVALAQALPGPASSQVGIAVGMLRAGYLGGLAAWLGFTLPSALALVAFGYGVSELGGVEDEAWLHGLKLAAVAIVHNPAARNTVVNPAASRSPNAPTSHESTSNTPHTLPFSSNRGMHTSALSRGSHAT